MNTMRNKAGLMCLMFFLLFIVSGTPVSAEPKAFDLPEHAKESSSEGSFCYLLPEADTRIYTADEVGIMPLQVTCYAKNEIYARHGRKFNSEELRDYFESQPWYQGTIEPGDFSDSLLNSIEQENVQTLAERERTLSWDGNGYALDQPGYNLWDVNAYLYSGDYNILSGLNLHSSTGMVIMDTDYFSLYLPFTPEFAYLQLDRDTFEIYYPPAREAGYGGVVVSISAYDWNNETFTDFPSYKICGRSGGKQFVAVFPTDVQFDPDDPAQADNYHVLMQWAQRLDDDSTDGSNPFTVTGY